MFNKFFDLIKKYWIEATLLVCLLSAFVSPTLSIAVNLLALGVLISRLIIRHQANKHLS